MVQQRYPAVDVAVPACGGQPEREVQGPHPVDPTLEDRREGAEVDRRDERQPVGPGHLFLLGQHVLGHVVADQRRDAGLGLAAQRPGRQPPLQRSAAGVHHLRPQVHQLQDVTGDVVGNVCCRCQSEGTDARVRVWWCYWSRGCGSEFIGLRKQLADAIRAHYGREFKPKILWFFFTDKVIWSAADKAKAAAENIHIMTEREVDYFSQLSEHLGRGYPISVPG